MAGRRIFEKLPFEIVEPTENEIPKAKFFPSRKFVFVGPKRYLTFDSYKTYGLDIYNFEAKPDDVYLVGFGRSGTTLHSEMVWIIGNDLDYEKAAKDFLPYTVPHLGYCLYGALDFMKQISEKEGASEEVIGIAKKYLELSLEGLAQRKGRRFLKSHLPLSLLPPHIFEVGAKVIYCARNPKDVLVSLAQLSQFYHDSSSAHDVKDWIYDFKNGLLLDGPYFEHLKEAWEKRNDPNFLFLFFEDTLKDKRQTIQKVADFLGKSLTKEEIDKLEHHLELENFKKNKSVNNDQMIKLGLARDNGKFIREGKIGNWKAIFDAEMQKEFDQLIEENLKGTGLKFPVV